MNKKASLLFGVTLVAVAILALGIALLADLGGLKISSAARTWPLLVVGAGLLFCIPPFLFRSNTGLGGLFIPGVPVLTTGCLLLAASSLANWGLWAHWWPLEVIALAVGFILAALFLRVVWLLIPASIIGLTGLALLFTALTGLWQAWAILWTVVPFAVGLPLLLIGIFKKLEGVKVAGIIICGVAGLAFAGMSALVPSQNLLVRMIGPAVILVLGALLIGSALLRKAEEAPAIPPEKTE